MNIKKHLLFLSCLLMAVNLSAKKNATPPSEKDMGAYVMVYHKDADHGLHMAISYDSYTWTALNNDKPVIAGDTIAMQHGIRDPHILRGPDGGFYLAMTDLHIFAQKEAAEKAGYKGIPAYRTTEWERDGRKYGWGNNRGLVLMKSFDLIHWKRANIDFSALTCPTGITDTHGNPIPWSEVGCVWAPETVYDSLTHQLIIHFTIRMKTGTNRIYYAYVNNDFNQLTSDPHLLFEAPLNGDGVPSYSVIDSDIIPFGGKWHLFYVSHEKTATVKHATADRLTGPYIMDNNYDDGERQGHEAPNCWERIPKHEGDTATYVVMFDNYHHRPHNFGFVETRDFQSFQPIGYFDAKGSKMHRTNFSEQKHGAVAPLTGAEAKALEKYWKKQQKK